MSKNLTAFHLGTIRNYIKRKLLPKIGESSGHAELVVLDQRKRGPVILCKGAQGEFIVKRYRSPKRFSNAKTAHEYFSEQGILCARIIHAQICLDPCGGVGTYFMVQERIRGPSADEVENRDEAVMRIGKALAFMHSHTRTTWGSIGKPPIWGILYKPSFQIISRQQKRGQKSFSDNRHETSMHRLNELRQRGGLTNTEADNLARSMEKAKSQIPQRSLYELIHGDLGPSQIIFRDGTPVFIDLDAVGFGCFVYELIRMECGLCRNDHERQSLRDSYFAEAGQAHLDIYNSAKRFYELTYHLGRANHCLKRSIQRNEQEGASHFLQQYEFHKEQLISFIN